MHNKNNERLDRIKNEEQFLREKDALNKLVGNTTEKFN